VNEEQYVVNSTQKTGKGLLIRFVKILLLNLLIRIIASLLACLVFMSVGKYGDANQV